MADDVAQTEVLRAPHVLEFPYQRSVGPVIGAFLGGLRDGKLLGITGSDGKVIVPPAEYDPITGEDTHDLVEVGPGGVVTAWAWAGRPRPDQPFDHPFAWALVRLDGADTALLHAVDAPAPDAVTTGMRVVARFRPEGQRQGDIHDLQCFVAERDAAEATR